MERIVLDASSAFWPPLAHYVGSRTWSHAQDSFIPRLEHTSIEYEGYHVTVQETVGDKEHAMGFGNSIQRSRTLLLHGAPRETLISLLEHARKLYHEPSRDSLSIYTWDIGWDMQHKQSPRDIDTVHLPPGCLKEVLDDADSFLTNEVVDSLYTRLGIPQTRVYMFHGIPGTGKTTLAHTMAGRLGMNLCVIEFVKDLTDVQLRKAFKEVPEHSIVLFEDLDCLFQARKSSDEALHNVSFAGILNAIDGVMHHKKILVVITCNDKSILDKAITRRVDYFMEFSHIGREEVSRMFSFFFPESPQADAFAAKVTGCRTTANVVQKFLLRHFLKGPLGVLEVDFASFNAEYRGSSGPEHLYS